MKFVCTADKNGELDPYNSTFYQYDEKGQLIRVDENKDSTQTYTYDSHGNIKKIKSYAYTKGEIPDNAQCEVDKFTYDEADPWPDKLSNITNGINEIVYDENGNPVSLDDMKVSWTNGRQLESFYEFDDDGNKVPFLSFTYDDNGIRTSKTFGDTTTYYTNIDGNVTSQYQLDENGNIINLAEFIYDSANDVIGFTYEGETYFYLKNMQNDVLAVVDSNGELMAEYDYSTWGWHTGWENENSNIYDVNPFRYRSYIYDDEMSMCYLQSRYYITTFGRFLNSDLPEYAQSQKNDFAGINLFAYCKNNPVNFSDPTGFKAKKEPTLAEQVVDIIIALLFFDDLSKNMKDVFGEDFTENFFDGLANLFILVPSTVRVIVEVIKSVPVYIVDVLNEKYEGTFSTENVVMDLALAFINAIISESGAELGALISAWAMSVLPAELLILIAGVINDNSMTPSQKVMLIFIDFISITASNIFSTIISSMDFSGTAKLISSILFSLVPVATDIITKIIIGKKNTAK